jgi:hypothetical protein
MTPSEIASYFRDLVDEPDSTFLTPANVKSYLDIGYTQLRREVSNIDPLIYATVLEFDITGTRSIDLTSSPSQVLGSTVANGARMMQLISLESISSAGDVIHAYNPVANMASRGAVRFAYSWQGQALKLGSETSDKVRLTYLPQHYVADWTDTDVTTQLDDLTMFHDVIVLFACSQYAMRDGAENQAVLRQLNQRVASLRDYLNSRTLESASYVERVGWDDFGWL